MSTLHEIQRRIELAAREPVTIVGVTKKQPPEKIRAAVEDGLKVLANNYVQEGRVLMGLVGKVEWHFIGHIQSRKAKELVDYQCIQSLDRLEVAKKLHEALERADARRSVLVEINIGGEEQKSGISPAQLDAFLRGLEMYPRLQVKGLMSMPPPLQPVDDRRPYFSEMKKIYARFPEFTTLSMGTSEDFLVAVEAGANMVRLGTVLFGSRPPQ